ncbi:hypothetical protein [Acidovorax sp. JHL-9]|uniref:hypothetical protein n=1 Tax=Acidovorax sp. JHL-9 TaxID=1276756 RepID=UPI00138AF2ED|nr:hypothetical protein [Acidovorax sp. JHL-9]
MLGVLGNHVGQTEALGHTYKLALIRALAEIATQEARSAVWSGAGTVGVPIHRIAERWLLYYWPLLAHPDKIPQSRAEAAGGKPIKFRSALSMLMEPFAQQGAYSGLTAWHLARTSDQLAVVQFWRTHAYYRRYRTFMTPRRTMLR